MAVAPVTDWRYYGKQGFSGKNYNSNQALKYLETRLSTLGQVPTQLAQNGVAFTPRVPNMQLCTQLLQFALSDAILRHELSGEYKAAVDCPRTNIWDQMPTIVPEYTQALAPSPNSSLGA